MQRSPFLGSIVISSITIKLASRKIYASGEFIRIEETDVSSKGTGNLNPLWTVRPPFNNVAAIPVVANSSTILFSVSEV